jgi:hypothetical protein
MQGDIDRMPIFADKRSASPLAVIALVLVLVCGLPGMAVGASELDAQVARGDDNVRLVSSNTHGVLLEVSAPAFSLDAAGAGGAAVLEEMCRQVRMPGFMTSLEAGRPALPVRTILVGVPPDVELEAVAESLAASTATAAATICPAPTRKQTVSDDGHVSTATATIAADPAVYGVNALYPSQPARVTDLGFMRSQRIVRLEVYPLQYNPVTGELRLNKQLRVALRFHGTTAPGAPVREPAEFENAFRGTLLNYDSAAAWRRSAPLDATATPWMPPNPAYKVMVKDEGLYQLSRQQLESAGLPVGTLDPRTFRMYNAGQEVAIRVTGQDDGVFNDGDALLFYGQGVDTRYTNENVYWLAYGGAPGLRMVEQPSVSASQVTSSFPATVRYEQNLFYISSLPMTPGYDHWYGERLQIAGAGAKVSRSFVLSMPRVASGAGTARLTARLAGNYDAAHHVRFYVNGNQVYDGAWSGRTLHDVSAGFSQGYLASGDNTVKLELINDAPGQIADQIHADWLAVEYGRDYITEDDRLVFGRPEAGAWRYEVKGFTGQDVEVYDVSAPAQVKRVTGLAVSSGSKVFLPLVLRGVSAAASGVSQPAYVSTPSAAATVRFGVNQTGAGRYIAVTPAERASVLRVEQDTSADVLSSPTSVDYLIISHRDFLTSLAPLAAHRAAQGLHVKTVDVQEVYDQFGYGLMSAEAIRDFIAYAYSQWPAPAPAHVLLVGDGAYDFRGFTSYGTPTFIPPYLEMVDPDTGETATDNRYVTVTAGDILPDLNIGRLPVNTAQEADAMVAKILSYEALPSADWMRRALFVTDDLQLGGGNFYEYSNGIADGSTLYQGNTVKFLPDAYARTKVYMATPPPNQQVGFCDYENPSVSCRSQIIDELNGPGALLVSYIGHGTRKNWAVERLFDEVALGQVNNAGRYPIMLPMTCNEGYFHDPNPAQTSLSEIGVRMQANGSIASWAPTGFGLAPGHDLLEKGLFLALFYDKVRLGAATTQGKLYLAANTPPGANYADLIDTFLLLGDPGLKVPVQ